MNQVIRNDTSHETMMVFKYTTQDIMRPIGNNDNNNNNNNIH